MTDRTFPFQPGVMLREAIVGAFRASGGSFEVWCSERGINPTSARRATYGINKGPKGRKMLADLIAAAGPDVVRVGYIARFRRYAEVLRHGAAL